MPLSVHAYGLIYTFKAIIARMTRDVARKPLGVYTCGSLFKLFISAITVFFYRHWIWYDNTEFDNDFVLQRSPGMGNLFSVQLFQFHSTMEYMQQQLEH